MVNTIMLRDALSNTLSKYRYLVRDLGSNSTARKEWISHLHTKSEMGYFSTHNWITFFIIILPGIHIKLLLPRLSILQVE